MAPWPEDDRAHLLGTISHASADGDFYGVALVQDDMLTIDGTGCVQLVRGQPEVFIGEAEQGGWNRTPEEAARLAAGILDALDALDKITTR